MKIILGKTGSGKTRKIAELASKLSLEGEGSLYISSELDVVGYKDLVTEHDANLSVMRYAFKQKVDDVLDEIELEENKDYKHIFVDVVPHQDLFSDRNDIADLLRCLYVLENLRDRKIYVTVQASYGDERLEDSNCVTIDYADY